MKQTLKKLFSLVILGACVLAMTACGSSSSSENSLKELDDATKSSLIESFESLTENISQLDEDQIKSYKEGDDAFSASAALAWESNGEYLGAYVENDADKSTVEVEDDTYVVTLNTKFEQRNATCVFTLDKNGNPTSVSIDPVYTMGEKMAQAGQNTVMGIGIVFIMLLFLSFLISLMKYIPAFVESFGKKKNAEPAPAPAPAPAAVPETVEEDVMDDGELVAVIAAAIAAAENTSTDGFVVRSIRKSTKRNWQRA